MEPVPEGEAPVREGLLAELRPAHEGGGEVVVVAVTAEGLGRQEPATFTCRIWEGKNNNHYTLCLDIFLAEMTAIY